MFRAVTYCYPTQKNKCLTPDGHSIENILMTIAQRSVLLKHFFFVRPKTERERESGGQQQQQNKIIIKFN